MRNRHLLAVALPILLTATAFGQAWPEDPTNPEGTPMIGRFAEPVVPVVPAGLSPAPYAPMINVLQADFPTALAEPGRVEATLDAQAKAVDKAQDSANADPSRNSGVDIRSDITHQPLIHIKARVVEVQRTDSLAISSVLDFITAEAGAAPFGESPFNQNSLNDARRRLSGITRLPVAGLVDASGQGAGMLVNLTSAHVNYVAALLATELHADTITAPQVTTLNGKNVQFRAGSWIPFSLGVNFIQSATNTIQEVFYRHVGTYISVTPQIVNWGRKHEGLGRVRDDYATVNPEAVLLREEDLRDQQAVMVAVMRDPEWVAWIDPKMQKLFRDHLSGSEPLDEATARTKLVGVLNQIIQHGVPRSVLHEKLGHQVAPPMLPLAQPEAHECEHCNWRPSDCTINLNLAVRLADPGDTPNDQKDGNGEVVSVRLATERNVRAISNVVQVKSGHGVVIGGLITMQDVERASKVPFLGDLPIVGAALRSKQSERIKTETLIFIEATVLPAFECCDECGHPAVKSETERDFCNGRTHLQGELCDGPLSYGMHRAGLQGDYLPRPTHGEQEYWRCYHQQQAHLRHHRLTTHVRDTFE